MDGCRRGRSPFEGLRFPLLRAPSPRGAFSSSATELNLYYFLTSSSRSMTACPHAFRHTRACGSEWSISKPARALRALRHPPRRPPVMLVPGRRALVGRSSRLWCGACVSCAFGPGRPRDRHTRACGSEWSISKPARALRALRHPPRWLSMVLVPGQALPHRNPGVRP